MRRTVTGTIHRMIDTPWPGIPIKFELIQLGSSAMPMISGHNTTVPNQSLTVRTDELGKFAVPLWTELRPVQPYYYRVKLPGEYLSFPLPPGAPIDISLIRRFKSVKAKALLELLGEDADLMDLYDQFRRQLIDDLITAATAGDLELKIETDKYYPHDQTLPSQIWNIAHNLGKYPSVTAVNSEGGTVSGAVDYLDENNIRITFTVPIRGKAYLN